MNFFRRRISMKEHEQDHWKSNSMELSHKFGEKADHLIETGERMANRNIRAAQQGKELVQLGHRYSDAAEYLDHRAIRNKKK